MLLLFLLIPGANDRSQKSQDNRPSASMVRREERDGSRVAHDVSNSAGRNRRLCKVQVVVGIAPASAFIVGLITFSSLSTTGFQPVCLWRHCD